MGKTGVEFLTKKSVRSGGPRPPSWNLPKYLKIFHDGELPIRCPNS